MPNTPFTAVTQHNEFKGTVALDGKILSITTLKELAALCNVPTALAPVGFCLSGVHHDNGVTEFYVMAAKSQEVLNEYINNPHALKKLIVKRFDGIINLSELPKYFKMLSVAATLSVLENRKVEYDSSEDVVWSEEAELQPHTKT
jgi:hypothetical protein